MAVAPFGFREVDVGEKARLVSGVFSRVAWRYDRMNDLMSLGAHRFWKDAAAARVNPQPGERIVDCAGGTGDMARRLRRLQGAAERRRGGEAGSILVIDANRDMVAAGRARGRDGDIDWVVGDAMGLPLANAAADAVCMAFGLRNVADTSQALREIRRVLRSGGRFVCLEFSRPPTATLRRVYDAYSFAVIPRLGGWVAREEEAYRYLIESIRRFPDQAALAEMMREAGFAQVEATNFSGGVCALHQGWAI
jgi:demethylmenaquinone methyltransferase/2-methoxy-6-polyprenyl-1,4-benzoquinol methylase